MDTLTHALSGALLARALTPAYRSPQGLLAAPGRRELRWFGPRVPVAQAVAAGFIAAAFPDADYVLRFASELAYLRGHRGVTHSLLLLPLWAAALGVALAFLFRNPAGWKRLSWIAGAAVAIHIAGDWITQFGTMLLAPLSDARFGLGAVFIIDLALSAIVLAGLLACALLPRSRAPAVLALALLPAWIAVCLVGRGEALAFAQRYASSQGLQPVLIDAAPRPASPFNWTVFVFDGTDYHIAHVNTRRREPLVAREGDLFIRRFSAPYAPLASARWQTRPKFGAGDDPALAREAWADPGFAFFRWFAQYPLLDHVERSGGSICVWFRDLRFDFPGRATVPFRFGMCRRDGRGWALHSLHGDGAAVPH